MLLESQRAPLEGIGKLLFVRVGIELDDDFVRGEIEVGGEGLGVEREGGHHGQEGRGERLTASFERMGCRHGLSCDGFYSAIRGNDAAARPYPMGRAPLHDPDSPVTLTRMTAEAMKDALAANRFPLVLCLADGQKVRVKHRDYMFVPPNGLVVEPFLAHLTGHRHHGFLDDVVRSGVGQLRLDGHGRD